MTIVKVSALQVYLETELQIKVGCRKKWNSIGYRLEYSSKTYFVQGSVSRCVMYHFNWSFLKPENNLSHFISSAKMILKVNVKIKLLSAGTPE